MGLRRTLRRLFGRASRAQPDTEVGESGPERADETIESIALPGDADWEDAAALVVVEDGTAHEFPLPNEVADPNQPVTILFGGTSADPNTLTWAGPPDVSPHADLLIKDADGTTRPIPETERKRK